MVLWDNRRLLHCATGCAARPLKPRFVNLKIALLAYKLCVAKYNYAVLTLYCKVIKWENAKLRDSPKATLVEINITAGTA